MSKKYALYASDKKVATFHYESTQDGYELHERVGDQVERTDRVSENEYIDAFDHFVNKIVQDGRIESDSEISAVVFRIVAPGKYFTFDRIVNDEFMEKLEDIYEQTPLHIDKMRNELAQVKNRLKKVKMMAISDSRFHKTISGPARIYAIPKEIREEFEMERFGYHGISISSVVTKEKELHGSIPEKTIVCHLGGGSSITALKDGESFDTTMGYSPLEGLPMSTRIGNIDVGAMMTIADLKDLDIKEIRDFAYYKCGLKGISEYSDDIRALLAATEEGNADAKLAIDHYVYKVKTQIGAYIAALGGVDRIIMTGTISERSEPMRKKILSGLENLGIVLDSKLNDEKITDHKFINAPNSGVSIEVVCTDEMGEMARRSLEML